MARVEKDDAREERIDMEVVVDAYGEEERAMGWYTYLGDKLALGSSQGAQLEVYTLHSPLDAIQQR